MPVLLHFMTDKWDQYDSLNQMCFMNFTGKSQYDDPHPVKHMTTQGSPDLTWSPGHVTLINATDR